MSHYEIAGYVPLAAQRRARPRALRSRHRGIRGLPDCRLESPRVGFYCRMVVSDTSGSEARSCAGVCGQLER